MATDCKNDECSGWSGRYHIQGCAYATPETSREAYSSCRVFDTGATRSPLGNKPQYEGYLNPLVLKRFGEYMLKHQTQADGQRREPDNWQKGIPPRSLVDSKMRHDMDVWLHHRSYSYAATEPMEEALCGVLFNTMAMLLHTLTQVAESEQAHDSCVPCRYYPQSLDAPPCNECRDHALFEAAKCRP